MTINNGGSLKTNVGKTQGCKLRTKSESFLTLADNKSWRGSRSFNRVSTLSENSKQMLSALCLKNKRKSLALHTWSRWSGDANLLAWFSNNVTHSEYLRVVCMGLQVRTSLENRLAGTKPTFLSRTNLELLACKGNEPPTSSIAVRPSVSACRPILSFLLMTGRNSRTSSHVSLCISQLIVH